MTKNTGYITTEPKKSFLSGLFGKKNGSNSGTTEPKKSFFSGLFGKKNGSNSGTTEPKKSFFSGLFGKKTIDQTGQAGGKKIQMRTFHFIKHKKYSERAFIAERPIIAADNAYEFMKIHYDIGNKQVSFKIHDRINNKKYKYTAKTLKDGTTVIKSAK